MVRGGQESAEPAAAGPVGSFERAAVFHFGELPAGAGGFGDAVAAAGRETAGAEAAAEVGSGEDNVDQPGRQDDYFVDHRAFQKRLHLVRAFGDRLQLALSRNGAVRFGEHTPPLVFRLAPSPVGTGLAPVILDIINHALRGYLSA